VKKKDMINVQRIERKDDLVIIRRIKEHEEDRNVDKVSKSKMLRTAERQTYGV